MIQIFKLKLIEILDKIKTEQTLIRSHLWLPHLKF